MMKQPTRFSSQAGIAIGPILFVIALLAILAAVMAGGGGDFQTATVSDRITNDIAAQANLIRNTINQCNLQYTLAVSTGSIGPATDPYPTSDTSNGTAVSALICSAKGSTVSLWNDNAMLLPPPTKGFNPWMYMDASGSGGGRCFWTTPTEGSPLSDTPLVAGLVRAATKFNSSATYNAATEAIYDSTSASQKFVIWITPPTGTADSHCLP